APLALTPDGKMLAIAIAGSASPSPVRLLDPATGREFATLALPHPEAVVWLCCSPDGSQLAAACGNQVIYVWDLPAIRKQLAAMGLDGALPPYPSAGNPGLAGPIQVHVLPGELAALQQANDPAHLRRQVGLYTLLLAFNPWHFWSYLQRGRAYGALG